jgi:hypothetical protein
MKLKQSILALSLVIVAHCVAGPRAVHSEAAAGPCVIGHTAAPFGFWTWPANSHVNVYLREPDFSAADAAAVRVAVENWDATAAENGSNVRFVWRGLTSETKTDRGDMTLLRGDVYDRKTKHLALLQAHSLRSDQLIDYALVIVDNRVKNAEVLTNVMAHEIGHSLGLLDCYQCNKKSTAMGLLKTSNEPNGMEGPTACDKVEVLAAYRELKLQVRPMPTELTLLKPAEDEGEEPEADDTPIVRKP